MRRLAGAFLLVGCGGGVPAELPNALYTVARLSCGNAEELVLGRGDLTTDEKEARIGEIRASCDPVFAIFEELSE